MTAAQPFRFQCVPNCGKCCSATPEMAIVEGLCRLYKDFVVELSIKATMVVADDADEEHLGRTGQMEGFAVPHYLGMLDFLRELATPHIVTASGQPYFLMVSTRGLGPASTGRCVHLGEDGGCGIYDRRPRMCRVVPLDFGVAEKDLGEFGRQRLQAWHARGLPCLTSAEAPLIHDGHSLVEPQWQADYQAARSMARFEAKAAALMTQAFFRGIGEQGARSVVTQLEQSGAGWWVGVNAIAFLHLFRQELPAAELDAMGFAPVPTPTQFATAQLPLIEDMLKTLPAGNAAADEAVIHRLADLREVYLGVLNVE